MSRPDVGTWRRARSRAALVVTAALVLIAAAAPSAAWAATAPTVPWCGNAASASDRPDAVAGRQVHVIYALPTDGVDRFAQLAPGITSDLSAAVTWWQHQDYTRSPRFDLAAFPCFPGGGSLDISQVRLPFDSSYYYDINTRLARLAQDLGAAGFADPDKKYLVYYDTPSPLPADVCGQGYEDPNLGGSRGYAAVYLAPNLVSTPATSGCGDLVSPDDHGGYSAITATHEMIHTFGALDTWSLVHPPHACPDSPAHACDDPLDIMQPSGHTYWLDNVLLDAGHDDYYAHVGTWWDVQDSTWLRHLNEPTYTLDVTLGVGAKSVVSDLPGVDCAAGAPCRSTWDNGTPVVLTAAPQDDYARAVWGGACAAAGTGLSCTLTMNADAPVTVSFLKSLAAASLSARATRTRVQAVLRLTRKPAPSEAQLACGTIRGLRLAQHAISGVLATCAWSVPRSGRGRRVSGVVEIDVDGGTTITRRFAVQVPR